MTDRITHDEARAMVRRLLEADGNPWALGKLLTYVEQYERDAQQEAREQAKPAETVGESGYSDSFLEHASKTPSQYDETCRKLAAELLSRRRQPAKPPPLSAELVEIVERLDELHRKATPGPWRAEVRPSRVDFCVISGASWSVCTVHYDDERRPVSEGDPELDPMKHSIEDTTLIAELRNSYPAISAALRSLGSK